MNTNKPFTRIDTSFNHLVFDGNQEMDGESCQLSIDFIKTLRIPDDNKKYNLPPGLGQFPLKHVEDYKNVPKSWQDHGGIFLPMYQSEAMWLKFNSRWPFAIKIATGKINAVSGDSWQPNLSKSVPQTTVAHDMLARDPIAHKKYMDEYELMVKNLTANMPQSNPDYVVSPKQPWLDGFNVGKGVIRQFVAMPLGQGYTVEEQLTNKAEHGGIQIIAYPMKAEHYKKLKNEKRKLNENAMLCCVSASASGASFSGALRSSSAEMGLGAGGFMKQDIYEDPYGIDVWDTTKPIRIFVHLLNSLEYTNVTGEQPPTKPLTPEEYKRHGYPWFDYYSDGPVLKGSDKLSKVDSIASIDIKNNINDNSNTLKIVNDGKW